MCSITDCRLWFPLSLYRTATNYSLKPLITKGVGKCDTKGKKNKPQINDISQKRV